MLVATAQLLVEDLPNMQGIVNIITISALVFLLVCGSASTDSSPHNSSKARRYVVMIISYRRFIERYGASCYISHILVIFIPSTCTTFYAKI